MYLEAIRTLKINETDVTVYKLVVRIMSIFFVECGAVRYVFYYTIYRKAPVRKPKGPLNYADTHGRYRLYIFFLLFTQEILIVSFMPMNANDNWPVFSALVTLHRNVAVVFLMGLIFQHFSSNGVCFNNKAARNRRSWNKLETSRTCTEQTRNRWVYSRLVNKVAFYQKRLSVWKYFYFSINCMCENNGNNQIHIFCVYDDN